VGLDGLLQQWQVNGEIPPAGAKERNVPMTLKHLLAMIVLLFGAGAVAKTEHPNVVVFLIDDMGVMDTSVPFLTDEAGQPKRYPLNDFYRTPGMERLAAQGIRFNNFCAQSVCSPTRASIITGQNATRHGTTTWINPATNNRGKNGPPNWNWTGVTKEDVTLPRVLSANGYTTIHVGKAHFGPLDAEGTDPLNVGFDVNVGGASWGRPKSYYAKDHYGNHPKYKKDKRGMTHNVPHLEKYYDTDTFLTEALTLEANDAVAKAVAGKKPFFLHMAHYAVHSPFNSDPRFAANYEGSGKSKNANAYATLIEGMDKSLNDILDQLEKLGVAEDTLVIFLGDNGSDAPLGDKHGHFSSAPLRGKKGSHYEGGMRVPFIAAWAKPSPANKWQKKLPIKQGAIQPQLGTVMDLYPTILALAGVENPKGHVVDGVDLAKQFAGKTNASRPDVFLMHFPHGPHRSEYFTSFRSGDWKVVYHYKPTGKGKFSHELYNLAADPFENDNLASKNPEKFGQMIAAMAKQLEAEGALFPVDKKGLELKPAVR
jgi:arylsulfatase A-like enzyme